MTITAAPEAAPADTWTPQFSPWRHGGWYVDNVRYKSGAVGCVSRNYPDGKWRIVCDPRPFDEQPTFKSRNEAARAERELATWIESVEVYGSRPATPETPASAHVHIGNVRIHVTRREDGTVLLDLDTSTYSPVAVAITSRDGEIWQGQLTH
ncbi:hypothetical protein [Arthrobacter sp. ISL-95]|uniref:hypothetical protein n=1 Tax=Arthrobacter sp. ISL-95 TaxID=2819116 RepID=UPI001BE688C7|nr:hypothetical protein [Arthrobacter sp. ISL-95]MBT2587922.1 hypothetical protein [Arthrobacter sp. ISL-95]